MSYRRVRCSLKHKRPDPDPEFRAMQQELQKLRRAHQKGRIDLRFLDESGFSLQPVIPYAWQSIGETIALPASSGKRLSVIGLLNYDNALESYVIEGYSNSAIVIAAIDAFSRTLAQPVLTPTGRKKPTVIVLDNASMHTSQAFAEQIPRWKKLGIRLRFLPPYCPELNIIEMLWRKIKYEWLPLDAYSDFKTLTRSVSKVLKGVGSKYQISFA
jgi:transposase